MTLPRPPDDITWELPESPELEARADGYRAAWAAAAAGGPPPRQEAYLEGLTEQERTLLRRHLENIDREYRGGVPKEPDRANSTVEFVHFAGQDDSRISELAFHLEGVPTPRPGITADFSLSPEVVAEEPSARSEEHTSELQSLRHLVC